MQQMDPRETRTYEGYEGNQGYAPNPEYSSPYQQNPSNMAFDDDQLDGLAQRIAQHMSQTQGPSGKIQPGFSKSDKASAGQRIALAIVSLAILVPLSAILIASVGGLNGLLAFGGACLSIILVNAFVNDAVHH